MAGAVVREPKNMHEVAVHDAIRRHAASLKGNKLLFIQKNGGDPTVASALLCAPSFLSNLSDTDVAAFKGKAEKHLNPTVVEARELTSKALREVEAAWEAAKQQIAAFGGLEKASSNE
jgi:hypothetical protein